VLAVKLRGIAAAAFVLALTLAQYTANAYALEVDAKAIVVKVVDGDTIRVRVVQVCSVDLADEVGEYVGRVRLADINAPELDTLEGKIARNALQNLLPPGTIVYLDIDDIYVFDKYGRLVAVVMVVEGDRLLVVNRWLLEKGYAVARDYPNEFTPSMPLYVDASIVERCEPCPHQEQLPVCPADTVEELVPSSPSVVEDHAYSSQQLLLGVVALVLAAVVAVRLYRWLRS
jgi:endonuclease YncB( thermonuclease family)